MKSTSLGKGIRASRKLAPKRTAKKVQADFSVVEDSPRVIAVLRRIGVRTGRKAVAAAKAAGVATAYMRNGKEFVKVEADGKTSVINPVFKRSSYYVNIKSGTKFNAVKK